VTWGAGATPCRQIQSLCSVHERGKFQVQRSKIRPLRGHDEWKGNYFCQKMDTARLHEHGSHTSIRCETSPFKQTANKTRCPHQRYVTRKMIARTPCTLHPGYICTSYCARGTGGSLTRRQTTVGSFFAAHFTGTPIPRTSQVVALAAILSLYVHEAVATEPEFLMEVSLGVVKESVNKPTQRLGVFLFFCHAVASHFCHT
jgi:hypothetical protein